MSQNQWMDNPNLQTTGAGIAECNQKQVDAWMQTYTDQRVNLWNPTNTSIQLEDIAYSLSNTFRFNGQLNQQVSVAVHSMAVAALMPEGLKLAGLLHDAHEAYIGDVITPVKWILGRVWTELEDRWEQAIARRFNIPWPQHPIVKTFDFAQFEVEARNFFTPDKFDTYGARREPVKGSLETYKAFKDETPAQVCEEFLSRAREWGAK